MVYQFGKGLSFFFTRREKEEKEPKLLCWRMVDFLFNFYSITWWYSLVNIFSTIWFERFAGVRSYMKYLLKKTKI